MYQVVLADPPWPYRTWKNKTSRTADSHYDVMSLTDIMGLPVNDWTADNAALFLWCTPPCILDAFNVIHAWGFTYKTFGFVWLKTNKVAGTIATGMGHYTRANTEPCLLAVKGRMPVMNRSMSQVIQSPRREHSRKPDEIYDRINQLYPEAHKLEMFARGKGAPGWDVWGHEAEEGIEL